MKFHQHSLRQKIVMGYIVAVVLVSGFVLLSWGNLNNLQDMVMSGEIVSDLFDATLEIRRFEKNYFLYETPEDFQELISYVKKAEELVGRKELALFTSSKVIAELDEHIQGYSKLLEKDTETLGVIAKLAWESDVRAKGKTIVTVAEMIDEDRKAIKKMYLESAKGHILVGIALLMVSGLAAGLIFYNKAVRPLSVLEKHMNRIADGEFSLIESQFKDSELVSLKIAFNKMLLELQARQTHLVQSEKLASLGTLVFGVAHELNNPLSNIYSSCQILREEIEVDDLEFKKELLSQIEAETDRARDVVSSVLDYSRMNEKKTFNLRRAVEETIRFIKAEVPPKITIRTDIPEKLMLFADKTKIQQVVLNLVKNAMDAMRAEGEISVSASREREKVEIVVQDNGSGMEPSTLSKIFDPFFSSKMDNKGYGLGLFIVHNIIEEHGGTISVDSSPNIGTVFTIVLPAEETQ